MHASSSRRGVVCTQLAPGCSLLGGGADGAPLPPTTAATSAGAAASAAGRLAALKGGHAVFGGLPASGEGGLFGTLGLGGGAGLGLPTLSGAALAALPPLRPPLGGGGGAASLGPALPPGLPGAWAGPGRAGGGAYAPLPHGPPAAHGLAYASAPGPLPAPPPAPDHVRHPLPALLPAGSLPPPSASASSPTLRRAQSVPVPAPPPLPDSPDRGRAPRPKRPQAPRCPRVRRALAAELELAAVMEARQAAAGGRPPPPAPLPPPLAAAWPGSDVEVGEMALDAVLAAAGPLPEAAVAAVVMRVAAGLAQLHAAGAVHRTLSAACVLVRGSPPCPATARLAAGDGAAVTPGAGRPLVGARVAGGPHPAPEAARARDGRVPYTPAGDMWALGALAAGALAGAPRGPTFCLPAALLGAAAPGVTQDGLQAWVDAALDACLSAAGASPAARRAVGALLRVDPAQRPPAAEVAAWAWVGGRGGSAGAGGLCAGGTPRPPRPLTPPRRGLAPAICPPVTDAAALDGLRRLWLEGGGGGSESGDGSSGVAAGPSGTAAPPADGAGPLAWLARLLPGRGGGGGEAPPPCAAGW